MNLRIESPEKFHNKGILSLGGVSFKENYSNPKKIGSSFHQVSSFEIKSPINGKHTIKKDLSR